MSNWWHIKNWFRVGHTISWKLNFYTLNGFLYLYKPFQNEFNYRQSEKKHEFVFNYLRKELNQIIEKYKTVEETKAINDNHENTIWTLWWQGEDLAPALVKACLESMRRNANGAKLIVITKANVNEYIDIPSYIIEKKERGYISFAQLSDIIRYSLLEKYGGLWLDSTIYTSSPIPEDYFNYQIFTLHTSWAKTCFVQHNLFHGFVIGSLAHGKLASFMKECFYEYWKDHDTLVDYLMIDYLIMLAYMTYPEIKEEIDSLPYSSERLYDLVNMLNTAFNKREFEKLENECIFSKLDWHRKYKETEGKKETYYSHIINQQLKL